MVFPTQSPSLVDEIEYVNQGVGMDPITFEWWYLVFLLACIIPTYCTLRRHFAQVQNDTSDVPADSR